MASVNENVNIKIREDGSRVVKRRLEEVGDAAVHAEAGIMNMQTVLLGLASGATLGAILRMADQFTNLQNRMRLVTTDASNLARVTSELGKIANDTRSDFVATAELYTRMATSSKELGLSQKELLSFTKSLNQAVILSGASAEEAAGGIRQLSQGMASGALRGDELNSVLENLPAVADVIAKGLGVTRGELRAMGQEGKLTANDIVEAFKKAEGELESGFATTVPTIGQSFTILKNNFMLFIAEVDKSYGITAGLAKAIMAISENLDILVPILAGVATTIATAFAPAVIIAFANQIKALWLLMMANPFVAIAAIVSGLVVALYSMRDAIKLGIDDTTTLGDLMRAVWENMTVWIKETAETAVGLWNLLLDVTDKSTSEIARMFADTTKGMKKDFNDFYADTGTGLGGLLRKVAKTLDAMLGFVTGFVVFAGRAIGELVDFVVNEWKRAYNAVAQFAENSANTLIDATNILREAGGFDPLSHVDFTTLETKGAKEFKGVGELWAESMDAGFGSMDGFFAGKADDLLAQAQEIGKARAAVEGALTGGGPATAKTGIDEDALKRAQKELERLKQALRGILDETDPVGAATRRLAEAHDTLTRAVKAGLIAQADADKAYETMKFQLRDQLDPLAALNRAIDENISLLKMSAQQREVESQMMQITQDMQMQGIKLTEAETAALRAKLMVEQELTKISQARDNFDMAGAAQQMADFKIQLDGLLASIRGGGTGEGDMAGALTQMLPWADLSQTQEQMAAYVQAHTDMYAQIKALEDARVIEHNTAQMLMAQADVRYMEQRLQGQRNFFSTLAGLSSSSNKKLAAIGKAAAITTAVIDGVVAIQKAWASAPYPANLPAVAATTVAQAANVAAIVSQNTAGFRTGGEFTVGGRGGSDSQMVAFRATPGEQVKINTPAQARALEEGSQQAPPQVNTKIVNVLDKSIVGDWAQSQDGEQLLVNIMMKNGFVPANG